MLPLDQLKIKWQQESFDKARHADYSSGPASHSSGSAAYNHHNNNDSRRGSGNHNSRSSSNSRGDRR